MTFRGQTLVAIAALSAILAILTAGGPATARAVSPDAAVDRPFATVQVWLDDDFITPDAPAGGFLQGGFTFWDTGAHDFARTDGVYVRMHPKEGSARPSDGHITADFAGHVVADLIVPKGGPGAVEVGFRKGSCDAARRCLAKDTPLELAGTGPPPDAPRGSLVSVAFHLVGDVVVGRPYLVSVEITPRGLWTFESLGMPDHLVVTAGRPGRPSIAEADVTPAGPPGTPYTGHLTLPATGDIDLTVSVPGDAGGDGTIPDATTTVTVVQGGRSTASPAASAGASPDGGSAGGAIPPVVWIAGAGLIVVVAGLVLRRVLADL